MTASHRVIPVAAADAPASTDDMTRRSALKLMAASLALVGGACSRPPDQRIYPFVDLPEAGRQYLPAYYATAFVRDGYAHGVLVGTRQGRPIKVEGNPLHPASLGATDVQTQASVLQLWDPDRSQSVVLRRGEAPDVAASIVPSTWTAFESAWRETAATLRTRSGEGLAFLTEAFTSPTLQAQLVRLLERFPRARWYRHTPSVSASTTEGAQLAYGRDVAPVLRFDRARYVLALGADPFSDGPAAVRHARDWAEARAEQLARGETPARGIALETTPGLFGARADERHALAPAEVEAVIGHVAGALFGDQRAAPNAETQPALAPLVARIAAALRRHAATRDGLIVAGPTLGAATHALVHRLNQRLGFVGRTVELIAPPDDVEGRTPGTLPELAAAIDARAVTALVVVGGNPAYASPREVGFAAALERVPFSAHWGLYRDETSERCTWHLPASHGYEAWSDARAFDGVASIVQPAIAPLYDTRSAHELLALLGDDGERDGHAIVRRAWRERWADAADADFEARWRSTLVHGVVEGSAAAPLAMARIAAPVETPAAAPMSSASPESPGSPMSSGSPMSPAAAAAPAPVGASHDAATVIGVFVADASVGDGSFANNGWLQELPRPFTSLTWDNAVRIGAATAQRLALSTGAVVSIEAGGERIEAPVWIDALHAEGAATLTLGYGRTAAGRVGNGVGFDAYRIAAVDGSPRALTLRPTGRRHDFAVRQQETDQHDRNLAKVVASDAALAKRPVTSTQAPRPSLYPPEASPVHAWAMVIDLDACIGCNACTIACQAENNIPVVGADQVALGRSMHWIRVDHYHGQPDAPTIFQPVPCMHCENAPCELVCPVGATVHDSEGLNVQVYNRCIGTRFCSNNCPYKVRRFNFLQYVDTTSEQAKAQRNPDVTVRHRGVMEKCSYCLQRITRARIEAEKAGRPIADGDVVTACQAVCPTRAIHFGDANDPDAEVVRARRSPRHYAMLEELATHPRTTYLARVANRPEEPA